MLRKEVVFVLVVALSIIVSGCASQELKELKIKYKIINYGVFIDEWDYTYLKLVIKGPPKDLKILLNDPEGDVLDWEYVSEEELVDGYEVLRLKMVRESEETPKRGVYKVVILRSKDIYQLYQDSPLEVYNTEDLVFHGYNLSIKNVKFIVDTYNSYSRTYWEINVLVDIVNNGDLPVFLDRVVLTIDDVKDEEGIYSCDLAPNDDCEVSETFYFSQSQLKKGVHLATLIFYSEEGVEIARYDSKIRIS